jgi:chromosome segregation ATPase
MTTKSIRSGCDLMADAIQFIKQEIEAKRGRLRKLKRRLEALLSQPDPDQSLIQAVEEDIRELEDALETDRAQLNAFEEEFAASCGP